eukprot:4076072-Amphidinium_carterae.1
MGPAGSAQLRQGQHVGNCTGWPTLVQTSLFRTSRDSGEEVPNPKQFKGENTGRFGYITSVAIHHVTRFAHERHAPALPNALELVA